MTRSVGRRSSLKIDPYWGPKSENKHRNTGPLQPIKTELINSLTITTAKRTHFGSESNLGGYNPLNLENRSIVSKQWQTCLK